MVDEHGLDVRMRRDVAGEGRRPVGWILVRGVVDLEVVDRQAGRLERLDDALGPLAAACLGLEAPDEGPIAGLQSATRDGLVGQRSAGIVEHGTDVAEALGRVGRLGLRELGIHDRDEDALVLGLLDERVEGIVTGVAHDGDAVRLGRHGLLELGDHLVRVPVGPLVGDVRPEGCLGRLRAVVDDRLEAAARPCRRGRTRGSLPNRTCRSPRRPRRLRSASTMDEGCMHSTR